MSSTLKPARVRLKDVIKNAIPRVKALVQMTVVILAGTNDVAYNELRNLTSAHRRRLGDPLHIEVIIFNAHTGMIFLIVICQSRTQKGSQ